MKILSTIIIIFVIALLTIRWANTLTTPRSGLVDGKFKPCPSSPNCVNSQAEKDCSCYIEPLYTTWDKLKNKLALTPRIVIVEENADYIHAEAHTLLFNFIDDVEFLKNSTGGYIDVKSSSRLGYSDLGANRSRIEQLREELKKGLK